jgi:hypothetical protein
MVKNYPNAHKLLEQIKKQPRGEGMDKGAKLRSPQEPHIFGYNDQDVATRKEMVNRIIKIFSEAGLTYDEAYITLEAVNDFLQYQSRFVCLQEV